MCWYSDSLIWTLDWENDVMVHLFRVSKHRFMSLNFEFQFWCRLLPWLELKAPKHLQKSNKDIFNMLTKENIKDEQHK